MGRNHLATRRSLKAGQGRLSLAGPLLALLPAPAGYLATNRPRIARTQAIRMPLSEIGFWEPSFQLSDELRNAGGGNRRAQQHSQSDSMDSSMIRCCANGRLGTFQMKFRERRNGREHNAGTERQQHEAHEAPDDGKQATIENNTLARGPAALQKSSLPQAHVIRLENADLRARVDGGLQRRSCFFFATNSPFVRTPRLLSEPSGGFALGFGERGRFLCQHEADGDKIRGVHLVIGDVIATGASDRIPQRNGPAVFDQYESTSRVVRNVVAPSAPETPKPISAPTVAPNSAACWSLRSRR